MQYFVTRSGLEIFDACRAYGLAELLHSLARGRAAPTITEVGGGYCVVMPRELHDASLTECEEWHGVFSQNSWQQVFLTYKKLWPGQRDRVKNSLERRAGEILGKAGSELRVTAEGDCTLPGALDPTAFKGLKGLTGGSYSEGPTTADELNWALGCLGAAVAQRYKIQKALGRKWEYYVTLPVPEEVRLGDFHTVRQLVYEKGLHYNGVRNAAAHFSLLLADAVREKGAGNPWFPMRFSSVVYFWLFQSGQQYKPSAGGVVQVGKLIGTALAHPEAASEMFRTWDYLFRRGSTKGGEDLAEAATELILTPSLESYYRHARIFLRYVVDRNKGVKHENLYTERALQEVMNYVQ